MKFIYMDVFFLKNIHIFVWNSPDLLELRPKQSIRFFLMIFRRVGGNIHFENGGGITTITPTPLVLRLSYRITFWLKKTILKWNKNLPIVKQ